MFPITQNHIDNLVDCLELGYEEIYLHGDGNMFDTEKASKDHIDFAPPRMIGHDYVLHFKKGDYTPKNVKELEQMFLAKKSKETAESMMPTQSVSVKTVPIRKKDKK